MSKNKLLQSLKIIVLGVILSFGISYLEAAWTNPPSSPPAGNVDAPINVSDAPQKKFGTLMIGNSNLMPSPGGNPVLAIENGFVNWGNTNLYGEVDVRKPFRVFKGNQLVFQVDPDQAVDLTNPNAWGTRVSGGLRVETGGLKVSANGNLGVEGYGRFTNLAGGGSVCADSSGKLILCAPPQTPPPPSPTLHQITYYDGNTDIPSGLANPFTHTCESNRLKGDSLANANIVCAYKASQNPGWTSQGAANYTDGSGADKVRPEWSGNYTNLLTCTDGKRKNQLTSVTCNMYY